MTVVHTRPVIKPVVRVPGLLYLIGLLLFWVAMIAFWVMWIAICMIAWICAFLYVVIWHWFRGGIIGRHRTGQRVQMPVPWRGWIPGGHADD